MHQGTEIHGDCRESGAVKSWKARRKHAAMTLAELIVGLFLFAIVIIPVFGIIPLSYLSVKKAEDFSTASLYAQEIANSYRIHNPGLMVPSLCTKKDVLLNNTEYYVHIGLYGIDLELPHTLVDVVVTLYWKKIPEQTRIMTRVHYGE